MLADTTNFPWDILGNVGAAGIAVIMCMLFLREIQRRDIATSRESAEARREFTAALKDITDRFSERMEGIERAIESLPCEGGHGPRKRNVAS